MIWNGFDITDTLRVIAQWNEGTSGDDTQTRLVFCSLGLLFPRSFVPSAMIDNPWAE